MLAEEFVYLFFLSKLIKKLDNLLFFVRVKIMKNGLLDLREEFGNLGSANLLGVCLGEMKQPELRFFEGIESIKNV